MNGPPCPPMLCHSPPLTHLTKYIANVQQIHLLQMYRKYIASVDQIYLSNIIANSNEVECVDYTQWWFSSSSFYFSCAVVLVKSDTITNTKY